MRLFVSIELPLGLRKKLYHIGCGLAESAHSVRPVKPQDMHLTLHFLGDVGEDRIQLLSGVVDSAAASNSCFTAAVRGVGTFGRGKSPTVAWAGVEPAAGLLGIHKSLADGLAGISMPVEQREYRPHITIARVKPGRGVGFLPRIVEEMASEDFGTIDVGSICLMKSTLSQSGAVYETITTARLG